jgi:hypothetical protein
LRAPAIARSAPAVSVAGVAPVTRSRTTASSGVDSTAAATRACASAASTPANESVRVTIGRAGSGRNSNAPRPDRVNCRTTNPFVSVASANDVRSTEPA